MLGEEEDLCRLPETAQPEGLHGAWAGCRSLLLADSGYEALGHCDHTQALSAQSPEMVWVCPATQAALTSVGLY